MTLAFHNFDPWLGVDVPWLVRLGANALHEPLYRDPFSTIAVHYLLLFGSLIVGALLSRPRPVPLSIFRENLPAG